MNQLCAVRKLPRPLRQRTVLAQAFGSEQPSRSNKGSAQQTSTCLQKRGCQSGVWHRWR